MIEVEQLDFQYPKSASPTLHDLNFEVRSGEVFGFLGPSGAGKSTTQNILAGLLPAWSGQVKVFGKSLRDWGREYYNEVGVSFELPNHYSKLSARENLEYFRALYRCETLRPEQVLEWVGLDQDIDRVVADFSKGMKNRLNLARSLLHGPRLWFLDEPTSGLDPVSAKGVRELVRARQAEGVTCVLTTHDMVAAQDICDRVAFIIEGRIAEIGAPEDLKRKYGKRELELVRREGQNELRERFSMDGLASNKDFLASLERGKLISMHSQECSLADVFVKVTGRELK